jgi:hypothetical protein
MKRTLLFSFSLLLAYGLMAQHAIAPSKDLLNKAVKVEHQRPSDGFDHPAAGVKEISDSPVYTPSETQLGISWYDLQSNYILQNRVYFDPADGNIQVVWTRGIEATAFADRGTGYNYFDGAQWQPQPTERIEDERTGWPNYAPLGPDGEIVVAHAVNNLKLSQRPQKYTGAWNYSILVGPAEAPKLTWPRMITNGPDHNTVHIIVNTYDPYQGQTEALLYYRSQDGAQTWDIAEEVIDGLGPDYYTEIGADAYAWAEPLGDTIAFLCASAWHDMFAMRSYDNGDNWEKIMIWEHPYPFFDFEVTLTDTFFCVDNSATIALDKTGKIHVTFGINRVLHDAVGTTYSYFPYVDGIGYWNEDMPAFSNDLSALASPQYGYATSEMVEDYNYVGYTQDVDGDGVITFITTSTGFPMSYRTIGVSTMPTITVDDDGFVFIVFSSTTETYDNFEWNYKKIWARSLHPGGYWSSFLHLTEDIVHIFDESYFPQLAPYSDDNIHLVYNNDATPGLAFSGDHDYQENRITYSSIPKTDFWPIRITENNKTDNLSISSVFPNPATTCGKIRIDLDVQSNVTMQLTDLTGKTVLKNDLGRVTVGSHDYDIDVTSLPSGIYFLQVTSGNTAKTEKLVVNH